MEYIHKDIFLYLFYIYCIVGFVKMSICNVYIMYGVMNFANLLDFVLVK